MRPKSISFSAVGFYLFFFVPMAAGAPPNGACDLPKDLQREIASKYPGKTVVTMSDLQEDDRGFFQADHGNSCPGLVKVDFYGEGRPTLALVLITYPVNGSVESTEDAHDATFTIGRGQNTGLGWSDPTFDGFQLPKISWGRSRPSRRKRDRVLAACKSRRMQVVMQDVRQTNWEEKKGNMAIIKAPPKQPKSVTIQARVEESVKTQLDQYAKFIDSTPSYVITEALKLLFKRDDEFKVWLGQQRSNGKIQDIKGGGLEETA